jgi:hypothetical protein
LSKYFEYFCDGAKTAMAPSRNGAKPQWSQAAMAPSRNGAAGPIGGGLPMFLLASPIMP